MDYEKLDDVLQAQKDSQEAEHDLRANVREAHHFIDKRDGQWEPEIVARMQDRPRYTFDKCGPIVDQIAGEIENADFTIRVRPAGGDADDDNAKIYDGLIRNIRNMSNGEAIFKAASRSAVTGGIDGWEILQGYAEADSFDQDLLFRKIHNFVDRVWFDPMAEEQDNSDANWVIIQSQITQTEAEERFKGKMVTGLSDDRLDTVYSFKPTNTLTIGKFLYKKPRNIKLVKMSNGMTYRDDDKFKKVRKELKQQGITETDSRIKKGWRVYSRLFSNDSWLTEPEETVFDMLPVVAMYGNYKVSENKRIYRGVVEKLFDAQRVYNYASSRAVEDVALAPTDKFWMTRTQAKGNTATLETLNTNNNPVQFYNMDPEAPPPFRTNGAQINQGLAEVTMRSSEDLNASAGLFSANMGDNPGLQSGVALDIQTSKADNGMTKWIEMVEVAICYTGKVCIPAIPRVYDSTRTVRILNEDGTFESQTINQRVKDEQTGEIVELNNLGAGQYDSVCEAGLAFKSRQKEAAAAFVEMAAVDPSLIEMGRDIWLKNMEQSGMQDVGDRARAAMVANGQIIDKQLTDEERQQMQEQQAQQSEQPDPMALAAQGAFLTGQADLKAAENKTAEIQGNFDIKMKGLEIDMKKIDLETQKFQIEKQDKNNVDAAKIDQGQQKLDQSAEELRMKEDNQNFNQHLSAEELHLKTQEQHHSHSNQDDNQDGTRPTRD